MMRLRSLSLTMLLALVVTTAASAAMAPPKQVKMTKSYVFTLSVGMPEQMWTRAQVRSRHPKTGEEMLRGSMGGAMSMGGSARHLEVHIRSRASGKVVAGARPAISAFDMSTQDAMAIKVPVAEMQGVMAGAGDLHYGNNVDLVAGHVYRVTVTLSGERAVFMIKVK